MTPIYGKIFVVATLYLFMNVLLKRTLVKRNPKLPPTNKHTVFKGLLLMYGGLILNLAETKYYGWNRFPESTGEWIMDIITSILYLVGALVLHKGFFPTVKRGVTHA
ncbi:hypothetical protein ACFYKX_10760 [Cytobacillus sp. FJAT-54145]|uniref:Uncharacterized protein n=1 Tax=Cytobacillus spartinae TaxID=3299023 RepID=A0ABW6KCT7_9BACI